MSNEEIKTEVRKLILDEMTLFAQEHRAEIVERAMTKWKLRQQDAQQETGNNVEQELQELD